MSDYITPARLKGERGWTDGLIKTFLGKPDETASNPHYRSGPPMRLYSLVRVNAVEASAEWQAVKAAKAGARAKIAKASKATAERKRAELLAAIERLEVSVVEKPMDLLRAEAVESYNLLWSSRGKDKYATVNDSPEFLDRITFNFVRHHLVTLKLANGDEYYRDTIVDSLSGRIGKNDAYSALWDKVTDAITDVYPELFSAALEAEKRQRDAELMAEMYR